MYEDGWVDWPFSWVFQPVQTHTSTSCSPSHAVPRPLCTLFCVLPVMLSQDPCVLCSVFCQSCCPRTAVRFVLCSSSHIVLGPLSTLFCALPVMLSQDSCVLCPVLSQSCCSRTPMYFVLCSPSHVVSGPLCALSCALTVMLFQDPYVLCSLFSQSCCLRTLVCFVLCSHSHVVPGPPWGAEVAERSDGPGWYGANGRQVWPGGAGSEQCPAEV